MMFIKDKKSIYVLFSSLWLLTCPGLSWAGDAATVIFKSGQVVKIDDGFRQVTEALKQYRQDGSGGGAIVELNLGGGTFLLNISEVVIACRDTCSGLTIMHQLDPKRGAYNTKIGIDQSRTEYKVNPPR
ncbi:MAG: hypothetical protein K1X79_11435 [Oligoflexia bacterium]|nr:hypothetical protein [Oligoflexia bacterium]